MIASISVLLASVLGFASAPARASTHEVEGATVIEALERHAHALNRAERDAEATHAWAELARREGLDPKQRALVVLRTLTSAERAHERDGEVEHLCLARAVLDEYLTREDAIAVFVDELRGRVPQIEEQLAHAVGPDWRRVCHPDAPEPVPTALCTEPSGAAANLSDSSCAPPVLDPSARRLTIAGATLTSLGAGALIGMGASLFGIHTRVNEIRELTVEKSNNGGSTPAMDARVETLYLEGKALEKASIALGVVGGASVVTGIVLLATGRHRSLKAFAVTPAATPRFAGLTITGRF